MNRASRDATLLAMATFIISLPLVLAVLVWLRVANYHGEGFLSTLMISNVLAAAVFFIGRQSARTARVVTWVVSAAAIFLLVQAVFALLSAN